MSSNAFFWTLIGPAIWMALLLSVVSGRADQAVEMEAFEAAAPKLESETKEASSEQPTLHASVLCLEFLGDGA